MPRQLPTAGHITDTAELELRHKLNEAGAGYVDRLWMDAATQRHWAAFQIADKINPHANFEDIVWLSLTCLWERWLPERPCFEQRSFRFPSGQIVR